MMKAWDEYYKDKNKVDILIKYSVKIPAKVDNFNIDDHPIHVRQQGGKINVNYHKKITQTLLNDLKNYIREKKQMPDKLLKKNPGQYIVGYIGETLPRINKEILDRKYKEGHVLLRTISQFDIYDVFIVDDLGNYYAILWPGPITSFPEMEKFQKDSDVIYIRDLINAMTEYFYFNFDECIRKVITSMENYFIYYKMKTYAQNSLLSKFIKKKIGKFRKLVKEFVIDKHYPYNESALSILRNNILFVYTIRNQIVHDKLRLKLNNTLFCKKAINTLLYIYRSDWTQNDKKVEYIYTLDFQFKMISELIIGLNLDKFEELEKRDPKVIDNNDEFDDWIFAGLRITKKEKRKVKK